MATAIPLFKKELQKLKNVAIAFPDNGAAKRFGKMFNGYDIIICNKVRKGNSRVIDILEGDPKGKHVCHS